MHLSMRLARPIRCSSSMASGQRKVKMLARQVPAQLNAEIMARVSG